MTTPPLPRHERLGDLLASSDDPAPRKTCRIEWLGQQSPFDNPVIAWNLMQGRYTPMQAELIRLAAAKARTRVRRNRLMEHDHQHAQAVVKGLRRTYLWSKENNFVCDVDYHDVDVLLGSDVGSEFVNLDDREDDQPVILQPPAEVVVLTTVSVATKEAVAGALVASS